MLSAAKKFFKKHCTIFLKKTARVMARKGKELRVRADMLLFPSQMVCYCPCCGFRFRSFVSGNYARQRAYYNPSRYARTRQDVLCPLCGALPRHRILALWCEAHKERLRAADILYFAAERSMTLWMRRNGVSFVSADLYRKADLRLDIQKTGLPDASYDAVFCNHVLEHVDDFRAALKEVYRLLRPAGFLICSFPMDPNVELLDEDPSVQTDAARRERFGQRDHRRVFGMRADQLLTEAGFTVEKIEGKDCPDEILPVVGPGDYDMNILFRCVKEKQ